jgi:hypothetical protein
MADAQSVKLIDLADDALGEENEYAYLRSHDWSYAPELGREVYRVSAWRLVLGRTHGEHLADTVGGNGEQARAELLETLRADGFTRLRFSDEEFFDRTGYKLGEVCFDGPDFD